MKFCQPHWDRLRKEIDDRGLTHLVAGDGEKATASMVRELEGHPEPADYDPLMSAHWAIMTNALKMGGLYLMGQDENGKDFCPLCEADYHGGHAQDWLTGCCDAQLEHAREMGLIPEPA
jgi:hypothetical protein